MARDLKCRLEIDFDDHGAIHGIRLVKDSPIEVNVEMSAPQGIEALKRFFEARIDSRNEFPNA